jgi:hypothetical protein
MDQTIQTFVRRIQSAESTAEKAKIMVEMGDERFNRYKATGSNKELKLATNCYFAARNFELRAG